MALFDAMYLNPPTLREKLDDLIEDHLGLEDDDEIIETLQSKIDELKVGKADAETPHAADEG